MSDEEGMEYCEGPLSGHTLIQQWLYDNAITYNLYGYRTFEILVKCWGCSSSVGRWAEIHVTDTCVYVRPPWSNTPPGKMEFADPQFFDKLLRCIDATSCNETLMSREWELRRRALTWKNHGLETNHS